MAEDDKGYLVDVRDGVLTLSFNRPDLGNPIPPHAVPQLLNLLEGIRHNPDVRTILVRGEGKNFSVGGDIKGFARQLERPLDQVQADFRKRLEVVSQLVAAFEARDIPVVAACQGGVAGAGLMWALGADVIIADESAFFIFAHQRVGLTPDGGVSYFLPRVVGPRRAAELVLTAAKIDAHEAFRIGIVSRIVPAANLQEEAQKQARRFAAAPQGVLRRAKRLMADSPTRSLTDQMEAECEAIVLSVGDADFAEGVNAFVEKRTPSFPSAR